MTTERFLKLISEWLDNRNDRDLRLRIASECRDAADLNARDEWLRLDILVRAALVEGEPRLRRLCLAPDV